MELQKIVIGDKITDGVYCLKAIHNKNGNFEVILKDKTGELLCELASERFVDSMNELVGGAVKTTFVVKNGMDTAPLGVIKSLTAAEKGTYKPSELFDGLSAEKIAEYTAVIKDSIKRIPDANVRAFVELVLTDDVITGLSLLPASLGHHARYAGGALATTASVTTLVIQYSLQYKRLNNGLYGTNIDWSILVASSLLQCVGMLDYITSENPFRKTNVGVERGYMSVLQRRLEKVCFSNPGIISDDVFARILNILASSVPMKSGVKSTRKEGAIFRGCLMLYEELDMLDSEIAGHDIEEGEEYFYNRKLRRNISLVEREVA
ncbi:hypothetical protein [Butyrivibrio hungatei]|uniref:Uncharacterized protein n=1 Tax=Butyrivibrio hungatei TaxID=185008 RepID=A0A1D9P5L0_9FIRM|nr:hypothetical protein [Butyrivibrio hungatei]AOZ97867.1 hypothetical protein bhn_II068 [Butyrivibrio hungatei]